MFVDIVAYALGDCSEPSCMGHRVLNKRVRGSNAYGTGVAVAVLVQYLH